MRIDSSWTSWEVQPTPMLQDRSWMARASVHEPFCGLGPKRATREQIPALLQSARADLHSPNHKWCGMWLWSLDVLQPLYHHEGTDLAWSQQYGRQEKVTEATRCFMTSLSPWSNWSWSLICNELPVLWANKFPLGVKSSLSRPNTV